MIWHWNHYDTLTKTRWKMPTRFNGNRSRPWSNTASGTDTLQTQVSCLFSHRFKDFCLGSLCNFPSCQTDFNPIGRSQGKRCRTWRWKPRSSLPNALTADGVIYMIRSVSSGIIHYCLVLLAIYGIKVMGTKCDVVTSLRAKISTWPRAQS